MAAGAFNVGKGSWAYYAGLPAANDALIAVVLESTGLVSDATLEDYATLADVLAGASNEQTTMGRKNLAGVSVTVDNTGDKVTLDFTDVTWTAATGNATGKILFCYDADTTAGTDANIVPLFFDDFVATPAGGDITYQVHASGLADAA